MRLNSFLRRLTFKLVGPFLCNTVVDGARSISFAMLQIMRISAKAASTLAAFLALHAAGGRGGFDKILGALLSTTDLACMKALALYASCSTCAEWMAMDGARSR